MTKWLAVCIAVIAGLGCKGETREVDRPETLQELQRCNDNRAEKDKYIKELQGRIADLEMKSGSGEYIVNITGDTMTITGKDGGAARPAGSSAPTKEQVNAFIGQVQKSRGSMQRCYQNALKKDSSLQMKTITMNVQVRFTASGKVSRATFSPRISDAFNQCMSAVAKRWQVTGAPAGVTFRQPITLSPQ